MSLHYSTAQVHNLIRQNEQTKKFFYKKYLRVSLIVFMTAKFISPNILNSLKWHALTLCIHFTVT